MQKTTLDFNREIIFGECGALLLANPAAEAASHFTRNASYISSAAVAGTLLGGALFWLAARIYDQVKQRRFNTKGLASDIGFFTPAAVAIGFLVYDPAIFLTSHRMLKEGDKVVSSVLVGQLVAFSLFLGCMNVYRALLFKIRGKSL
jgi:hypothetical protein